MDDTQRSAFVAFLEVAVATVRDFETRADAAVSGPDGQGKYEQFMRGKAEFLASIADEAERFADAFPEAVARLERFSASASSSLSVGSVFFMSALLYPEDHQPGQDNDLEALLRRVSENDV